MLKAHYGVVGVWLFSPSGDKNGSNMCAEPSLLILGHLGVCFGVLFWNRYEGHLSEYKGLSAFLDIALAPKLLPGFFLLLPSPFLSSLVNIISVI